MAPPAKMNAARKATRRGTRVLLNAAAVALQTVSEPAATSAWQPATGLARPHSTRSRATVQQKYPPPPPPRAGLSGTVLSSLASPSHRSVSSARQSKKGEDVQGDTDGQGDDTAIPSTTPSYFLVKSEPHEFSIQDLQKRPDSTNDWDGVRNYQARNIMRSMKMGDRAFFYHSSCKVPSVVGTVRIVQEARPDPTALDPNHKYYDPKSTHDKCRWDIVSVQLEQIYPVPVSLLELKTAAQDDPILADMSLFRNSRLSVQHVTEPQWNAVEELMEQKQPAGETPLN